MDKSNRLFDLRREYNLGGLKIDQVNPDPIAQFNHWFEQALNAEVAEPNAMTLATASAEGRVSARVVLLKEYSQRGFVFFTNYKSRKGFNLHENPSAALAFLWLELERQVRIEGLIEKTSSAESDEYFLSRPRESQLAAWASDQSTAIISRDVLTESYKHLEKEFEGVPIPRPPYWGGYRLIPDAIEFWQGGPNRIHERILYLRVENENLWNRQLLAP